VGRCLSAVRLGGAEARVIVIDNASSDGSVQVARAADPGAEIVQTGRNLGYTANNLGLGRAETPYALILNPDVELRPGALGALLDFAAAHPHAAAVGCRLLNPDGSLQHSVFRFPSLTQAVVGFFELLPLDSVRNGRYPVESYDRPHRVEHALGACLLVRMSAVRQVGLLDPGFFMYFEETDWCYRARHAGWDVWYTPDATAVHQGGHSTRRDHEAMSVAFYRSQRRFYRKHYPRWKQLILAALRVVGVSYWALRTMKGIARGRVDRNLARRRFASYLAIVRL
jgi:GT2 family glycosyltransferase